MRTGNPAIHPDSPDFPPWLKARQIEELAILDQTYKTGQDRVTLGEAHIWALLANTNKRAESAPFKPSDIMPKRVKRQTDEEMQAMFFRSGSA